MNFVSTFTFTLPCALWTFGSSNRRFVQSVLRGSEEKGTESNIDVNKSDSNMAYSNLSSYPITKEQFSGDLTLNPRERYNYIIFIKISQRGDLSFDIEASFLLMRGMVLYFSVYYDRRHVMQYFILLHHHDAK